MSRSPLEPRSAYRAWCSIGTRWSDNDVYGHVNNTVYYQWFDTAVNVWMIERGLIDHAADNPICLVAETSCRYAAPLAFPGRIEVGLKLSRLGTSSLTWQLGVFGAGAVKAAAQGHFVHVCVDRESRRPVPIPDAWRKVLKSLETN